MVSLDDKDFYPFNHLAGSKYVYFNRTFKSSAAFSQLVSSITCRLLTENLEWRRWKKKYKFYDLFHIYLCVPTTWTPPLNAVVTLETWLLVTLYKLHLLIYFMCVQTPPMVLLWRSKDNLMELVLSLHSVDSRVQTQVTRLNAVTLRAMSAATDDGDSSDESENSAELLPCTHYSTLCQGHRLSAYVGICWNTSFQIVLRKSGCSETHSGRRHGCQMGVAFEQLGW